MEFANFPGWSLQTSPLQYLLAAVPAVLQYGKLHFKLGTRMWIWLNCTGDVKYWYCILSFLLLQQILEEKVFAGELIKTWKSSLWFHSMTLLFLIWYLAGSLSSPDNSDSLPTWGRWIWEKWNYLSFISENISSSLSRSVQKGSINRVTVELISVLIREPETVCAPSDHSN